MVELKGLPLPCIPNKASLPKWRKEALLCLITNDEFLNYLIEK